MNLFTQASTQLLSAGNYDANSKREYAVPQIPRPYTLNNDHEEEGYLQPEHRQQKSAQSP